MPGIARKHQLMGSLVYHIFNRGHNKVPIFHCNKDYEYFIDLLLSYKQKHGFKLYNWVLMENHYHILIEHSEPEQISKFMAGIARSYSYYCSRHYDHVGHLWQGRFKSQAIEKEDYLFKCARYIERNPVVAGLVSRAWDYEYSSAKYYTSGAGYGIVNSNAMFDEFGLELNSCYVNYKNYLLDENDDNDNKMFESLEKPMGKKLFLSKLIKQGNHYMPRRRGRSGNISSVSN